MPWFTNTARVLSFWFPSQSVCVCVWLCGVVEEFLHTEGYIQVNQDAGSVQTAVASLVSEFGWGVNSKGRMCVLYVIAKAKRLLKGTWLWRPIAADLEPRLRKSRLRLAARALTRFLQKKHH